MARADRKGTTAGIFTVPSAREGWDAGGLYAGGDSYSATESNGGNSPEPESRERTAIIAHNGEKETKSTAQVLWNQFTTSDLMREIMEPPFLQ